MDRRYPSRYGFTLVEIMITVLIIGTLLAIAVPNMSYVRDQSRQKSCIANLIQIRGAKDEWGFELRKADTATPTDNDLFGNGKYLVKKPSCPAGGSYRLRRLNQDPRCSVTGAFTHRISALN